MDQAITEDLPARALLSMVPQWYQADCGPNRYTLQIKDKSHEFFSQRPLTPKLKDFLKTLNDSASSFVDNPLLPQPGFVSLMQEHFAIQWLEAVAPNVDWIRIVKYLNSVAARTFENKQVSINLVIAEKIGTKYVTWPKRQKFFDQLGGTPFTYFKVDFKGRFIDYCEVPWEAIKDATHYQYHPSFLHPINSILDDDEVSAHVTSNGDIVIMRKAGLVASKRKGHWKIYDLATFKNSIVDCLNHYRSGANLFEVMFDLSFKRHGALLVYDPNQKVIDKVMNKESKMSSTIPICGQSIISRSVKGIAIGNADGPITKRRLLAEIASVDGAVIFNENRILAVGAVIQSHSKVGSQSGARTTAAKSAYHYGGYPIKISSDGEITIYFTSVDGEKKSPALMEFL